MSLTMSGNFGAYHPYHPYHPYLSLAASWVCLLPVGMVRMVEVLWSKVSSTHTFDCSERLWSTMIPTKDFNLLIIQLTFTAGDELAGFFLAIIIQADVDGGGGNGGFMLLEAFDTWRHPDVNFEQFQGRVMANNQSLVSGELIGGQEAIYTTYFGNKVHFVIWNNFDHSINSVTYGSKILDIEYGSGDPLGDPSADAGNDTAPFLSGTILKSAGDGMIEIHNPSIGKRIILDWRKSSNPQRTAEDDTVDQAGVNALGQLYRVWVDFDWPEQSPDGNFYHPLNTLAGALAKVADGGSIKIMPGTTNERQTIHNDKTIRISAPIGGVTIGG